MIERDRDAHAEARALPQDDRRARMDRDDVPDDLRVDAAVRVVDRERPVLALEHDARGGTEFVLRSKVERLVREPFAAALRRIEAIEREALCVCGAC